MTAENVIIALVAVALIPAAAFVILYAVWAPWYRSTAGWHLMTFTANLALLLALGLLRRSIGDVPWLTVAFVVLYLAMAIQLWWRLALLVSHHRADRRLEAAQAIPPDPTEESSQWQA